MTTRAGLRVRTNRLGLPFISLLLLQLFSRALYAQTPITGINWFPIGPADISNGQTYGTGSDRVNVSGRATAIAVNPKNSNDIWLGTASGGVWHSTNAGVNWLPMSDNEASLAIGAIALDNCTSNQCGVIYAGTGENGIRRDTYYGMGLLIGQISGGEFSQFGWNLVGADVFKFASINNVVLDPTTSGASKVIYVTLSSGVTASATESTVTAPTPPQGYGIYKSTNAGTSWSLLSVAGTGGAKPTDLEMDPTSNTTLYAGFQATGVFKSTDAGATWCPLNPGIALPAGCTAATGLPNPATTAFDHVQIAIYRPSAANPAVLYVLTGNCTSLIVNACPASVYKSSDGGTTWTQSTASILASCTDFNGFIYSRYTHALTIHPTNPATVFIGGVYLFESTDSGNTFCDVGTTQVHPDHHALVFPDPSNPMRMYDTSDGGFAFTTDGGNSWASGNSDLQISEFQSVASSALTSRIFGGTQDNGAELWLGTRIWDHRLDGDVGSTILDRDNVMTLFGTNYYLTPQKSTDGGTLAGWDYITGGIGGSDPASFYPPLVEAPSGAHNLYFGTNLLYQSPNTGGAWVPVSPVLGGTTTVFPDITTSNVITAIAVAPSNANRIYIGYYDGEMFVTSAPCATTACWKAVGGAAKGLPGAPITRIAVDPGNADIAYATFSGFSSGAHVFKTTSAGNTWTPAASGLPGIPTNTITLESSSILWVGTDDGVYRSSNGGGSWSRYGNGLPHVPVYEISIDSLRGRLYAATHGRGTFILTQPFLSNFEGWVNNDIWDIPVYGTGFAGSVATPPGSACTMQLVQRNGAICASATTDAMGGTISFDNSGNLVTSKGGFYDGKSVAWGCYNGSCIQGKTIAECNPATNPITSVLVSCGTQVGIDHILGCPAQANPPSTILGLSGMPASGTGSGGGGGGGGAPNPGAGAGAIAAPTLFDLIPSVQGRNGVQVLCTASVALNAGDTQLNALQKTRDAVNSSASCQQNSVSAVVRGVPPESEELEDLLASPPRLALRAPGAVGGQLFTSVRTAPGAATGECLDVNGIGSPMLNQVAVMKVDLETAPSGAAGGTVSVMERSSLGACLTKVTTTAGESASQISSELAAAFQAPGIPGPSNCPAMQNPRDVTADGTSVVTVLASELRVCNTDNSVGVLIGPKELPNPQHRALQYAAKVLCGPLTPAVLARERIHAPAAEGLYYTAVNLHNPTDRRTSIRVKVAVARDDGKPGPISRFFDFVLGPDEAISIDCNQISRFLDAKYGFIDGFVVIESDVELDVVAVYTAAGRDGTVRTLHTERVPGRLQP